MEYIGIDVHKRESQICILTDDGQSIEQRIRTDRGRLGAVLARPRARILLEASTESEWVARCLEELGHEVVVADPNFAAMYAHRSRRVKTDRRDARTLAEACRAGTYRAAHRASDDARRLRGELAMRETLVRTRVRAINVVRALLRQEGLRVRSGAPAAFRRRLREVALPPTLAPIVAPLVTLLAQLDDLIAAADRGLAQRARTDLTVQRLTTVPGVGPVIATAFVATLDDPHRFRDPGQVTSYLGLVPREHSSGDRRQRGAITKAGNTRMRWLLVEAAWTVCRVRTTATAPLRQWADAVARRRGKRVAVVALARRLARVLYALWRDGVDYDPAVLDRAARRTAKAA